MDKSQLAARKGLEKKQSKRRQWEIKTWKQIQNENKQFYPDVSGWSAECQGHGLPCSPKMTGWAQACQKEPGTYNDAEA